LPKKLNMDKKYQVYGMGNALVDLELIVSDEFLNSHNIEKGIMTLVEEETQNKIMKAIEDSDTTMQCGGSAANSVIAVSQLGGRSFYSCKVANDELGKFYINDLVNNGVDTNLQYHPLKTGITGKCLVMITEDAERTMNTFLGITSNFSKEELDFTALADSQYLYIEGYLVTSPLAVEAMKIAKDFAVKNNIKVAMTFSDPSMVMYFKDQLVDIIDSGVDLLFCNEQEACLYTDSENLEEASSKLSKIAKNWVVTRGAKGALIFDGKNTISIKSHKVEAVDTNGAGDMFAGAFLYGITNGCSFKTAGDLASLASSRVVSQFGPRLNVLEVARLKQIIM